MATLHVMCGFSSVTVMPKFPNFLSFYDSPILKTCDGGVF